jgi:hypothetical protein
MRDIATRQRRCRHSLPAAVAVAMALLAAACSSGSSSVAGSGGPSNAGSWSSPSAVAFSACMRSQGVPNYPDPDSSGQLPKTSAQLLGVSTSQYDAAQQACRHLLLTGGSLQQREEQCIENGGPCPPALLQQMLTADRKFAQCMRSHGWPNFPDPTPQSDGPVFDITAAGISDAESHTHQFESKLDVCERLVGGNAPYVFG